MRMKCKNRSHFSKAETSSNKEAKQLNYLTAMYRNSERKIKSLAFFKTGKESNLSSDTCFFSYKCCTNYIQKHTARVLGEQEAFSSTFKIELLCLPGLPALPESSQQVTPPQLLESIKSPWSLVLRDEVRGKLLVSCLWRCDPHIKVKRATQHVTESQPETTKDVHFISPPITSLHSWQSREGAANMDACDGTPATWAFYHKAQINCSPVIHASQHLPCIWTAIYTYSRSVSMSQSAKQWSRELWANATFAVQGSATL